MFRLTVVLFFLESSRSQSLVLEDTRSRFFEKDNLLDGLHETSVIPINSHKKNLEVRELQNWASHLNVGQIVSVAIDKANQPVILHRASRTWNVDSFDEHMQIRSTNLIPYSTIARLNPINGHIESTWGSNLLSMPHGIAIDGEGNTYIADAGLHQVMRIPNGSKKPDMTLGEAFIPGHDDYHFCQPTSIAVSRNGKIFFVADGYCNARVMKFDFNGRLQKIIYGDWNVVHSITLLEKEDLLCVADREGQKIDCFRAGIDENTNNNDTGLLIKTFPNVGRVFGIDSKDHGLYGVLGFPHVGMFGIDLSTDELWNLTARMNLAAPHSLAISKDGDYLYVADTSSVVKYVK